MPPREPGLRVAVTGGAGFIGARLCTLLSLLPDVSSVVVLDDLSTGRRDALPCGVEFLRGCVRDRAAVETAVSGADALIHLAARSSVADSVRQPVDTYETNSLGTAVVLDAARRAGVGLAVLASSAAVYGDCPRLPLRESEPPLPRNPYGASKLAAEGYAFACAATYGLPVLVLRLFNVFGPGQLSRGPDGAVLPSLLAHALRGEPVPLSGDGTQSRDFTYVDDVCRVIATAVRRGVSHPGPVNLATGTATSLRELVSLLAEVLGNPVDSALGPARPADIRHSRADTALLGRLFPDFAPTALRDGLAATLAAVRLEGRWPAVRGV